MGLIIAGLGIYFLIGVALASKVETTIGRFQDNWEFMIAAVFWLPISTVVVIKLLYDEIK